MSTHSAALSRRSFLITAGTVIASAHDSEPDLKHNRKGLANGRIWKSVEENLRTGMVMGIVDMSFWSRFTLFELELGGMKIEPRAFDVFEPFGSQKVTYGQASDGVTAFSLAIRQI